MRWISSTPSTLGKRREVLGRSTSAAGLLVIARSRSKKRMKPRTAERCRVAERAPRPLSAELHEVRRDNRPVELRGRRHPRAFAEPAQLGEVPGVRLERAWREGAFHPQMVEVNIHPPVEIHAVNVPPQGLGFAKNTWFDQDAAGLRSWGMRARIHRLSPSQRAADGVRVVRRGRSPVRGHRAQEWRDARGRRGAPCGPVARRRDALVHRRAGAQHRAGRRPAGRRALRGRARRRSHAAFRASEPVRRRPQPRRRRRRPRRRRGLRTNPLASRLDLAPHDRRRADPHEAPAPQRARAAPRPRVPALPPRARAAPRAQTGALRVCHPALRPLDAEPAARAGTPSPQERAPTSCPGRADERRRPARSSTWSTGTPARVATPCATTIPTRAGFPRATTATPRGPCMRSRSRSLAGCTWTRGRSGPMPKASEVCENSPAPSSPASPSPKTQRRRAPSEGMLRAAAERPVAISMASVAHDSESPVSSGLAPIGTTPAEPPSSTPVSADVTEAPASSPRSKPPSIAAAEDEPPSVVSSPSTQPSPTAPPPSPRNGDRPRETPVKPLLASEALVEDLAPLEPSRHVARFWCAAVGVGFASLGALPLLGLRGGGTLGAVSSFFLLGAVTVGAALTRVSYRRRAVAMLALGLLVALLGLGGTGPAAGIAHDAVGARVHAPARGDRPARGAALPRPLPRLCRRAMAPLGGVRRGAALHRHARASFGGVLAGSRDGGHARGARRRRGELRRLHGRRDHGRGHVCRAQRARRARHGARALGLEPPRRARGLAHARRA